MYPMYLNSELKYQYMETVNVKAKTYRVHLFSEIYNVWCQ